MSRSSPRSLASALLRAAFEVPFAWIAPPTCAACDEPVGGPRVFCPACATSVVRRPFDGEEGGTWAPFSYGGAVAQAVRRYKYGGRPDLARPLGHLLRAAASVFAGSIDFVVPVPLHPRRRVERGFDQAALLGRQVARGLGCACRPQVLRRMRHGPAQASLSREARLASTGLELEADARVLAGARILLVDDVVTTGATLSSCRATLLRAGVANVDALALARADL